MSFESDGVVVLTIRDSVSNRFTDTQCGNIAESHPNAYTCWLKNQPSLLLTNREDCIALLRDKKKIIDDIREKFTEDVALLREKFYEDAAPLRKKFDEDIAPLWKKFTGDAAPLEKKLDEDVALLEKKFTEDVALLEKKFTEDMTPLENRFENNLMEHITCKQGLIAIDITKKCMYFLTETETLRYELSTHRLFARPRTHPCKEQKEIATIKEAIL